MVHKQQNRKKRTKPLLPHLKLRSQIMLYLFTIIVCSLSIISVGTELFPTHLTFLVYAVAFCSLVLAGYYLFSYFFKDISLLTDAEIKKHPLLNYLAVNYRRRTFLFAVPGFFLNCIFAAFNIFIGVKSLSAWYISLAVYYVLLCFMRFCLLHHEFIEKKRSQSIEEEREWKIFAHCGGLLIIMSIALCGVVILMISEGYGKSYPIYVTYAVSIYTFAKVISATVNMVKARKLKLPQVICVRNIGYADALVSMLSLQTAMFAAFGSNDADLVVTMNTITGFFVCIAIACMGISMLLSSHKQLRTAAQYRHFGDDPNNNQERTGEK